MNRPISSDEWLRAMAEKVEAEGPQTVAVEGRGRLTLVSEEEFRRLSERKKTFLDALRGLGDLSELDLERDQTPARAVDF